MCDRCLKSAVLSPILPPKLLRAFQIPPLQNRLTVCYLSPASRKLKGRSESRRNSESELWDSRLVQPWPLIRQPFSLSAKMKGRTPSWYCGVGAKKWTYKSRVKTKWENKYYSNSLAILHVGTLLSFNSKAGTVPKWPVGWATRDLSVT